MIATIHKSLCFAPVIRFQGIPKSSWKNPLKFGFPVAVSHPAPFTMLHIDAQHERPKRLNPIVKHFNYIRIDQTIRCQSTCMSIGIPPSTPSTFYQIDGVYSSRQPSISDRRHVFFTSTRQPNTFIFVNHFVKSTQHRTLFGVSQSPISHRVTLAMMQPIF